MYNVYIRVDISLTVHCPPTILGDRGFEALFNRLCLHQRYCTFIAVVIRYINP